MYSCTIVQLYTVWRIFTIGVTRVRCGGPGRFELQEVHAGVQEDNNESVPPAGEDDDLQDNWHRLQRFGRFLRQSSSCEECGKKIGTNIYLSNDLR